MSEEQAFQVLVIDDEEDIRDMICDCLELHSLKLKTYKAKDGVEALAKMRNQKFDLIITDLNMPKMDGKQLISELKNLHKDFRPSNIIVASGHVEKEMLKETPGGVSIIRKPFTVEDLNRYISVILSAKKKAKTSSASKTVSNKLNVEFINPFIDATLEVLQVMANVEAVKDFVFIKEDNKNLGDISGLIPISSKTHMGSMAITFPESVYLKVMSEMLGEECTEINDENKDGVAELCNQIFGNAKALLNKQGFFLDMTIPSVITGYNHEVNHAVKNANVLGVYFKTQYGTFVVECVVVEKQAS